MNCKEKLLEVRDLHKVYTNALQSAAGNKDHYGNGTDKIQ